jgi:hypothetical protein
MQNVKKIAVGVVAAVASVAANAALPTEASAAFTTLTGNVTDILAAVWPLVATLVGGFTLIKLFKRGAGKL